MDRSILTLVAAICTVAYSPIWGQDSGGTGNRTVAPTEAGTGTSTITDPTTATSGTGTSGTGTAGTGISGTSLSGSNSSRTNRPVAERSDASRTDATTADVDGTNRRYYGWVAFITVLVVLAVFAANRYRSSTVSRSR
ncbi:MAG: hypothetical protein JWM11_5645 [Planctomycetaceae bacterium]|nr:hypothetical protein [Planctomycetaceae bacterium]